MQVFSQNSYNLGSGLKAAQTLKINSNVSNNSTVKLGEPGDNFENSQPRVKFSSSLEPPGCGTGDGLHA